MDELIIHHHEQGSEKWKTLISGKDGKSLLFHGGK